jgi:hypothetical protein
MTLGRSTTAPRSREPSVDVSSTFVILSVVVAEGVLRRATIVGSRMRDERKEAEKRVGLMRSAKTVEVS